LFLILILEQQKMINENDCGKIREPWLELEPNRALVKNRNKNLSELCHR
jgi:hypothetical protein